MSSRARSGRARYDEAEPILLRSHDVILATVNSESNFMATESFQRLVDLYDGANHLYQCLIIAADAEGGEMRYDFKRSTEAHDRAPLYFYLAPDAPIALLGKD